jgi:hypothetical protein
MEALLRSKKGCASLIACLFAAYGTNQGWDLQQILVVTGPLMGYVGVEGAVEHRKAKNSSHGSGSWPSSAARCSRDC